ncbi:hypothetical protein ASG40_07720 [Methylobacterium sp. Leaf399]|uniref:hypothetical protein n=1 Tax=unclassified Methylobacterium TaxID=2615210 RepID=UPI0007021D53|nr:MULTISPECIES: hypothetical protein [unclassified Methylobacterium]KQP52703.1 hypothetical protein ASF39_07345 [Methylobacterium sp. Leaf108]KQT11883.1 hypothetical protein ASG40_07720 [Methylobacterium sp. Leaf399]
MFKSIVVAAALAVVSTGGALAGSRTLSVWGAQVDVPSSQVQAPAFDARLSERGGSRFMAYGDPRNVEPRNVEAARENNGYRDDEHAR